MDVSSRPASTARTKGYYARLVALMGAGTAAAFTASTLKWEGNELLGYRDIAGIATACGGVTGHGIEVNRRYSPAECDEMNAREAVRHVEGVLACAPAAQGYQLRAFADLAYNAGIGGFCGSSVRRNFNAGQAVAACRGLLAWNKATFDAAGAARQRRQGQACVPSKTRPGKFLCTVRGLTRRRAYYTEICLTGLLPDRTPENLPARLEGVLK
ncbi:glycoside hydrolase family protein [Sphingomonas sp. SFZ2018-12]|uniref:glycoside hydrolase family protein n=1 Tax=Sphingomonas sp. SFZ2018-12 TaxID=2683197 RepID=UPI001F0EE541|nr:glycoside hydrolase family protein [Sphingomonas sp. SFZ2018-12]MCH4893371.1 glycoside hydrolase family protein [Sphingomonas sp. SFZ2018-12]